MKKFLSILLNFMLIFSSLQAGSIHANNVGILDAEKEKSKDFLDKVEIVLDKATDTFGNKIKDKKLKDKLKEKKEEIKKTLDEAKEKIENENSKSDIKKIAIDTRKIVVLKVVSGITKTTELEDGIDSEIADTKQEKIDAIDTIKDSLKNGDEYSLIIKTKYSSKKILSLFKMFESDTKIDFLYNDGSMKFFEVFVPDDGIFANEILGEIESGNIPDSFLGIYIVKPEVFSINEISLSGENIDKTWGVKKYNPNLYLDKISGNTKKIKVGIIDTGIDYNHPDLKGRVSKGYDFINNDDDAFDDQGHGTHVSGTIGANLNNNGILGVNPYVEFVPLKICNSRGFCPSYAVIKALDYSKNNEIDILNMSLGGRGDPETNPICSGIENVVKSGKIVVAASGNSNVDTSSFVPGGCSSAITVGAVSQNMERANFSNYGNKVDVAAPGIGVYSTIPNGGYRELSGTSMATPHIVGMVSVMKTLKPSLSTGEIKTILKNNGLDVLTDSGKPVGRFANMEKIVELLSKKEEVIVEEKADVISPLPGIPTPSQEQENTNIVEKEEVILEEKEVAKDPEIEKKDSDIVWDESFVNEAIFVDEVIPETENYLELLEKTKKANELLEKELEVESIKQEERPKETIKINLFDEDGLDTNSVDNGVYEKIEFTPEVVKPIESKSYPEIQYFDIEGNQTDGNTKINTNNDDFILGGEIEGKTSDYFIDGAKKGVEINNLSGTGVYSKLKISEYLTGILDNTGFTGTGKVLEGEQVLEKINYENHTENLFIDGAKKGIEINSLSGTGNLETIKLYTKEELNNQLLNSSGSLQSELGEKLNTNILEENIESFNTSEIFIDGAIKNEGIEINSIGEEIEVFDINDGLLENKIEDNLVNGEFDYGYGDFQEYKNNLSAPVDINEILNIKLNTNEDDKLEELYKDYGDDYSGLTKTGIINNEELKEIKKTEDGININSFDTEGLNIIEGETIVGNNFVYRFRRARNYVYNVSDENLGTVKSYKREYEVITKEVGTLYIKVLDGYLRPQYILKLNILPLPVVEAEVFVGEKYSKALPRASNYRYKLSGSIANDVKLTRGYSNYTLISDKPGVVFLDVTTYENLEGTHTLKLTIKKQPDPIEYNLNIYQHESLDFYFPNKTNYTFYTENIDGGNGTVWRYNGYIKFSATLEGKVIYKVYNDFMHLYTININITQKPIYKELEEFNLRKKCIASTSGSEIFVSNSEIIDVESYSNGYCFTGKKAGDVEVYFKTNGKHLETNKITIKALPVPEVHNITIQDGKTTKMYLPNDVSSRYNFLISSNDNGVISASGYENYVNITGKFEGNVELKIRDTKDYLVRYIINIKVIPEPPIVLESSTYVGKSTNFSVPGSTWYYNFTYSEIGKVSLVAGNNSVYTKGIKSGSIEIYLKDSYGKHKYTLKLEIKPIPEPVEYNIDIQLWDSKVIYLPENVTNYDISATNLGLFDEGNLNANQNSFTLNTVRSGSSTVYLVEKTGYKWTKYKININVKPPEFNYTLIESESVNARVNINHTYSVSDSSVAQIHEYQREVYGHDKEFEGVRGLKAGITKINVSNSSQGIVQVRNIIVLPKPEIKVLNCTTQMNGECHFDIKNSNFYYETTIDRSYIDARGSQSRFVIDSEVTGDIKVHIKSYTGDYYTHELNIKILPGPPKVKECVIAPGSSCLIENLRSSTGVYEFKYSELGIVSLYKTRKYITGKDEYSTNLEIVGTKPGNVEIYIYKAQDLVAIIKTEVVDLKPITVNDTLIKVDQGEKIDGKILTGGGNYYVEKNGLERFSIDNIKDENGRYIQEANFDLHTFEAKNYYPTIVDQYNQRYNITVAVRDTVLQLGDEKVILQTGEKYLIPVYENFQFIEKIEIESKLDYDVIYVRKVSRENGTNYLELYAREPGTVDLSVTDKEGTTVEVEVIVEGDIEEDVINEPENGIRYIRDWVNGSNRNGYAHWIEIEAIEKGTNKNVAYGKDITGKYDSKTGLGYSSIVDNNKETYGEGIETGDNYVLIDLGQKYDIEKVNILHYFKDYRTYNGTKTEVSNDGINWTVLFNSAESGVYEEPLDGSGKSYNIEETIDTLSSIENELDNISKELGVNINSSGIEINSAENAYRCENGNTGEYYTRPYNSLCKNNGYGNAWVCNDGYIDLDIGYYGNINSCIKKEKVSSVIKYHNTILKLRNLAGKLSSEDSQKLINKLNNNRDKYSQAEILTYLVDDLLNMLDKKIDKRYKDLEDVIDIWKELKIVADNGKYCYDGCFYYDNLKGKSRHQIEEYVLNFSNKIFDFKLQYDDDFKNSYNSQIQEILKTGGTEGEIANGLKEGIIEGTKDYLMSYYDLVNSLGDLTFKGISAGLTSAWSIIKSPIESTKNAIELVKVETKKLYDKLLVLTGYERAKGGSYVGTNIALDAADPAGKVLKFAGAGFFGRLSGKVDDLIIGKLSYNDKILGQMSKRNWTKVDIENAIKSSYKKGKSTDNYDGKNEPATVFFVSDNQYVVINNKTGSVVQISDKNDLGWVVDARIYDIK